MENDEKNFIENNENANYDEKRELTEKHSTEIPKKNKNWKIRFGRLLGRFLLFVLVVFLVVGVLLALWIHKYFGPMNLDNPNADLLNTWLIVRDFSKETPEVREKLLINYLKHYGPEAEESVPSRLVGATKKITRHFFKSRLDRVQSWGDTRTCRSFVRSEYAVRPENLVKDRYVLPEDIKPTSELEAFRTSKEYTSVPPAQMRTELNCRYLVREWFHWKMKIYSKLPEDKKNDFIRKSAKEMIWWQDFYCDILRRMDLPVPSLLELLRELDLTILWWYESTSDSEELARLLWFKDLLISANVANDFGREFNMVKLSSNSPLSSSKIIKIFDRKKMKK
ncbi:MAG: hypothetical protein Q4G69_04705 [Planctomycetia bacterium]|nr:hypothetical protein [Planctomycetia bacterium]